MKTTEQSSKEWRESLTYERSVNKRRLKQIQHLLVENHQLKKELEEKDLLIDTLRGGVDNSIRPAWNHVS